jgi:NADPH-dependent 2,4-dienoyl-CoA reductase/sulfur reductase-like enzyme
MISPSERYQPEPYDVAVVGGGPAGLAATVAAADAGARVVLVDAGAALGGQYWRHPPEPTDAGSVRPDEVAKQHHDLARYRTLLDSIHGHETAGRVRVLGSHQVWTASASGEQGFTLRAVDQSIRPVRELVVDARSLVLAPGAYDRQIPFPGWELPGVLTAGGAQALLKGNGVLAGQRVLVAGTGPFLLSVGAGLAVAGATVVGVYEAASPRRWLRHLGAVGRNLTKLGEGVSYTATLTKHRVRYRTRSTVISAEGSDRLEAVTVAQLDHTGRVRPGTEQRIAVDALAVGWGFTPQLELPLALGCSSRLDVDGSMVIAVDDDQRSSVAAVYIAGEACGVGGAALAVVEGEIAGAAAAAACWLGTPDATRSRSLRASRARLRSFARAMHLVYPEPRGWIERVSDDTLVCRCEEITAGRLRQVVDAYEVTDPRSAKLLARVGMGWCQGRVCGYASSCLVADRSASNYQPSLLAERPLAVPVPLGMLAEPELTTVEEDH